MKRLPAAKRREQLLDVASEVFSREGYARATTAQLAKAAGVTEPIIYRHFASKRDLFVALIDRSAAQTIAHWERALAGVKDPVERLSRLTGTNPLTSEQGRDAYRVFLQAITEVHDEHVRRAVGDHMRTLHTFFTKEVRAAQEHRKVTRVFSAELIAWSLIHVGLGYGVTDILQVEGHGEDAQGQTVRGLLHRVLLRRHDEDDKPRRRATQPRSPA